MGDFKMKYKKIKKNKGVSLFESLCGSILVLGLITSAVNLSIEELKKRELLSQANLPITLLKAVDMRIAIDGYNYSLWTFPEKLNTRSLIKDFSNNNFISRFNMKCGKTNGWKPQSDINKNQKIKSNLISCGQDFGSNKMYEMEILQSKSNDNKLKSFEIILKLNNKFQMTKENILNQNELIQKIKADFPKTKKGILSVGRFDYTDLNKKISIMECKTIGNNCIIKAAWRSNGFNEKLRLDGTNNIVNNNIGFSKTYIENNLKCLLWKKEGSNYINKEVDCGIGLYKGINPVTAKIETTVNDITYNKDIILNERCNKYDAYFNKIGETACGIYKENGSDNVLQVVDELNIQDLISNKAILTLKDLISNKINTDILEISNKLNGIDNTKKITLNTLSVKQGKNEKTNLSLTKMEVLSVLSKSLFKSNVDIYKNKNHEALIVSKKTKMGKKGTESIIEDNLRIKTKTNVGFLNITESAIKNGDPCDFKFLNNIIRNGRNLLICRMDKNKRLKWLNMQEGKIGYFLSKCPNGWHKLGESNGKTLMGSGNIVDKYRGMLKYKVGDNGGESYHKITLTELPSHRHNYKDYYFAEYWGNNGAKNHIGNQRPDSDNNIYTKNEQSEYVGNNTPHENRMPYNIVNICEYQYGDKMDELDKEPNINVDDYWYPYPIEIGDWIDVGKAMNCSKDLHVRSDITEKDSNGKIVDLGKKDYWMRSCKQKQEQYNKWRKKNSLTNEIKYTGQIDTNHKIVSAQEIWTKGTSLYNKWTNVSNYYDCGSSLLETKENKNNNYTITLLCKINRERTYQERLQKEGSLSILGYRNWGSLKKENKTFIEPKPFSVNAVTSCDSWDWIDKSNQSMKPFNQSRTCKTTGRIKDVVYEINKTIEKRYEKPLCLKKSEISKMARNGDDITKLNTSCITDFSNMFYGLKKFNQDISKWDVSNGIDFNGMFHGAKKFNQDISKWDVSKGINFNGMFNDATSFNKPLGDWDVSNSKSFISMFEDAVSFNQDINSWNVGKSKSFVKMFKSAGKFNKPLGNWNVESGEDFSYMFLCAYYFNQDISKWNVSKGKKFVYTFSMTNEFNQAIGNWNMSNAIDIKGMFLNARKFNKTINNWDVSNITDFTSVFHAATDFNQPLDKWDMSNAKTLRTMFNEAKSFNQPIGNWDVSNVTNIGFTFKGASAFNQPLENWDVSNVSNFSAFLHQAESFNYPLSKWDVSKGRDFSYMFNGAESFDQNISNWNIKNGSNWNYFHQSSKLKKNQIPKKFY